MRNPATRSKHRPRPSRAPPRLSPTPLGTRDWGLGRTGSPERLAPQSTVAGTHPKGCHHDQAARQSLGHHCHRAPLQALTPKSKVPTSEGTRSPPAALRRRGPRRPHGPFPGMGTHPRIPRRDSRKARWPGSRGSAYSLPHPAVADKGRFSSLSTLEPHSVFKGPRGTPWARPFGKELEGNNGAAAPESRAGLGRRSLNSCRVCLKKP